MRNRNSTSEHLGWVVLPLVAAVILPTVCLLWFMTAAVRNERLAIRQKLVDSYTDEAHVVAATLAQTWKNRESQLLAQAELLEQKSCLQVLPSSFSGVVIFDKNDMIYPVLETTKEVESSPTLQDAWLLEFVDNNYAEAIRAYQEVVDPNAVSVLNQTALAGQARCLSKAGKLAEAKTVYEQLAQFTGEQTNPIITAQSRIRLAQMYLATLDPKLVPYCQQVLQSRLMDLNISTSARTYLMDQVITMVKNAGIVDKLSDVVQQEQACLSFEKTSLQAVETFTAKSAAIPNYGIHRINEDMFGYALKQNNRRIIGIIDSQQLISELTAAAKELDDNIVFYRLYDPAGQLVCGRPVIYAGITIREMGLFLSTPLNGMYSGWKLELYFSGDIFQAAASKQQIVYIWTSVLVIGLMILFVFFAAREILHQARLNRMKNNFVATVTHELKTPLSSMRLLVDTLLDGNYTNQQQCKEYLELISHENQRLSRMIDSFLTFSRMERNKQVFDFQPVSPNEISDATAEAVQPKMAQPGCHFGLSVADNLPKIRADKDAMVTVLVNLLDNAYKYSNAEKKIELRVYSENNSVCFVVRDNGIGISRRLQKKIFDRFYQVDSSLSRRAEGCGLGLSIVKFIVDAHKGTVDIESKPEQGSCFTVKLPI